MSSSGTISFKARLKHWLAADSAFKWIAALGCLLTGSSLWAGLAADDYLQAVVLRNLPLPRSMSGRFDLFRFASGDRGKARALMDIGLFPWTADPTTRFAFFRPLSAATHVLDYALWPDAPWMMHAQSVLWFFVAILSVGAIYRRFIPNRWVAGLALLLFAVDDTHGPAVGWIANRNSIIALALGLPVLAIHDRWRRDGWKPGPWLGGALLFVALLAGESALAIVAYIAAYALHVDRGSRSARAAALLPYVMVLGVWRVAYSALGYGVSGSGLYIDPAHQPLAFLGAVGRRLPFLLVGEFALPRSDLGQIYEFVAPNGVAWMLGYALLVLVLLGSVALRLWRREAMVRFFTTGLVLSAIPVCAAFVSDRLLVFVSVGAMAVVAQLIVAATSFGERIARAFLVLIHLVVAPPLLVLRSRFNDYQLWIDAAERNIPKTPDIASKTVAIINPPNDLFYSYVPAERVVRGQPRPARLRGLANVVTWVDVTRVDPKTLRVHPQDGFFAHDLERMLRSAITAMPVGSVVTVDGMTVTVTALTADGRPSEVLFRFDLPLEDPSFAWFSWTRHGYQPWIPPGVGQSVRLPPHDFQRAMLDIEDMLTAR